MAEDLEIIKEVWQGSVTLRFTLASHEIASSGKPAPLHLVLQRNSYLPLFNEKIIKHFQPYINDSQDREIWYDYNGQPLKWQYTVGVSFDLLCKNQYLPLDITVHFQDFPDENLIRCHPIEVVESHFMSMLKEADQLKHRGQVMNNMNKTQHKQLWNSLRNNNFEQFWSVNKKLMEGSDGTDLFKYIPVRLYHEDCIYYKLIVPTKSSDFGSLMTLRDYLEMMTNLFLAHRNLGQFITVIQGIEPSLETPLQWLSKHMSGADNFLHVILIKR